MSTILEIPQTQIHPNSLIYKGIENDFFSNLDNQRNSDVTTNEITNKNSYNEPLKDASKVKTY
jgi:hypothetical protein